MNNLRPYEDFRSLNEALVDDDKLKSEIEEFADLAEQIEDQGKKLKKLEKRYKELHNVILPVIEQIEDTEDAILEMEGIIVKIKSKGYKRENYKYKEALDWLKVRVNAKMKKILDESLEANKGFSNIATKLEAQRRNTKTTQGVNEGINLKDSLKRIMDSVKRIVQKISKNIKKYNSDLRMDMNAFKQKVA